MPLRVVVAASAEAAAARELGLTGGGITACLGDINSGVVNILLLDGGEEPMFEFPPPLCGLFVMASRTALRGGVLARWAMMVLVLDLEMVVPWPRIFAMELAVGANSLDVALDGLKMDALLRLSSLPLLLLLLLVPSAAVPATPGTRLVKVDEREAPLVSFVLVDDAAVPEARILRREPIDPPPIGAGFNILVVPELIRKLGCRD